MGDRTLHGSFFEIRVGGTVLVLPIIAVNLLRSQFVEEAVALLVAFQAMEIEGIAQQPFDVDLLVRVVYVVRGGDGTAYLGHPLHPPVEVLGPDLTQDLSLPLGPPGLHPDRHSLSHMNHQ